MAAVVIIFRSMVENDSTCLERCMFLERILQIFIRPFFNLIILRDE